jgi:hypothetical protein
MNLPGSGHWCPCGDHSSWHGPGTLALTSSWTWFVPALHSSLTGCLILHLQHSLVTIVASLLSLLGILKPVAGALLDGDFKNAVAHATFQLERIEQWAKYKAADKAPQSLLVPAKKEAGAWPWEAPVSDTVQAAGDKVVDTAADLIQAAATGVGQVKAAVKSTVGL